MGSVFGELSRTAEFAERDSQKLVDVLSKNTSRDLWADSAYRSQANEEELAALGLRSHIHKKGQRNTPLSEAQRRAAPALVA